jgi:hypothetical protein
MDKFALRSMDAGPAQDYYSVLARVIAEVSQDHAHFRSFVYELARVKLRQELYGHFVDGKWPEIEEQVRGLEAAIDRIESDFARNAPLLHFNSETGLIRATDEQSTHNALTLSPGSQEGMIVGDDRAFVQSPIFSLSAYEGHTSSLQNVSETNDPFANPVLRKRLRSLFWRSIQLIVAVIFGGAIYAATVARSDFGLFGLHGVDKSLNISATNEVGKEENVALGKLQAKSVAAAAIRRAASDMPLPTEYGVYAVANGQLTELDLLPIRAPDQRVAVSASISTPSRVHLPVGQLHFVVFRRDLATNAPDRVSVRVVARVARALTFGSAGNAKVANVEGSWVVRSSSYQMKVAPVPDNPEMIIVRPDSDLVFPAGRYALVLKGLAYDFTIDGPLIDPAHCLERTDALNTPVYTECRKL